MADPRSTSRPQPLARLGFVGGGQLARMMVPAATRLGCTCIVLDPTPGAPAAQIASRQIVADFHDGDALRELAAACDVLTYDLEDIDAATLQELADEGHAIFPAPRVLATVQDKLTQKQLYRDHGIPTADYAGIDSPTTDAFAAFGYPLVQKARRGGYDGRGVAILKSAADFDDHLPVASLLERFVPARKEISVLVARGRDGQTACYPPVEMVVHPEANLLDMLLAPADLPEAVVSEARRIAIAVTEALDGVGIFGVEMFWTEDDTVLVNEVAPRTHNSGHHTIEANTTDQFEQHLRAVLGLPLGSTATLIPAALINLLGEVGSTGCPVVHGLEEALALPGVCVHMYGKHESRPHRKMGHVTVVDPDREEARARAERVRDILRITGEESQ